MHAYKLLPGGAALLAVADGAGSAERSGEGAQLAVRQALSALEAALAEKWSQDQAGWETLLHKAFEQASQAVVQLAKAEDVLPRVFATTLTCAVAWDEGLAVAQIGDGVVVARRGDGGLFAATEPQHGEYANETFFITQDDALERMRASFYPEPAQELALLTDGLMRLALNTATNEPHQPFFDPLLAFAAQAEDAVQAREQLAAFLASERVCARTDDDKTLLLAARNRGD
jgi:hypothetical protein